MGLFGWLFDSTLKERHNESLFQPKKWKKGNDIYGVRGRDFSPNDDEGKLDHLDKNMGVSRSGFYHSYYRGWSEVRIDRLGKPFKVERIYTAPWIRQALSTRDYVLVRLLYFVLLALSVVLFVFAMTRRVGSNYCWYVALFGMPAVIVLSVCIWIFFSYVKAPRKMTLWEHKSTSVYLKRASLAHAIILAATALSTCLYVILNPADQPWLQLMNVGLELVAAGCAFAVFWLEKRMKYEDVPNTNKAPAGSFEIW